MNLEPTKKEKPPLLMKDHLGEHAVCHIAAALLSAGASFDEKKFIKHALSSLDQLELKARVQHIISVMAMHLPTSFPEAAKILHRIKEHWSLPHKNSEQTTTFAAWPIIDYVAHYGINHPEIALPLLRYLTPMYTAEFAIRPFIEKHNETTYNTLLTWCLDPDEHVRRLASEGIRPRLPWAKRLPQYIEDPTAVLDLLCYLKDDPSDYVRRSVANNLNDISKDHPNDLIETCNDWLKEDVPERLWIVRHATRTLVKAGNPLVFPLLGYTADPKVSISAIQLSDQPINLGDSLSFSTKITSTALQNQRIVVDYAIHFMKANGQLSAKVFKWKQLALHPDQTIDITKAHSFKKINTRKYYSGLHQVEVLINGQPSTPATVSSFQLMS